MKRSNTSIKSNVGLLQGEKLYIQRARETFPILVRQAHAGKIITYSQLADELGMPNPRNLNFVLGAIGNAILKLRTINKENIPFINFLVVGKNSHIPGNGISGFTRNKKFSLLAKSEKYKQFQYDIDTICSYEDWNKILSQLELLPLKNDVIPIEQLTQLSEHSHSAGESKFHLDFKNYLKDHPQIFGLRNIVKCETEYTFYSADKIDVMYWGKNEIVGVEAKSHISEEIDILRGIFQCIKYSALINAHQIYENKDIPFRVILALENELPSKFKGICNQLGVNVIDNIRQK